LSHGIKLNNQQSLIKTTIRAEQNYFSVLLSLLLLLGSGRRQGDNWLAGAQIRCMDGQKEKNKKAVWDVFMRRIGTMSVVGRFVFVFMMDYNGIRLEP
jgi:hypothetical protein